MTEQVIIRLLIIFITLYYTICINAGCKKREDSCISYIQASVSKIESPSQGNINQDIDLTVYFGCSNGCGQFGSFSETSSDFERTIIVTAKYEGCICTQDVPTRKTIYKFKTSQPGVYYLKFWQQNNVYLVDTLNIQ